MAVDMLNFSLEEDQRERIRVKRKSALKYPHFEGREEYFSWDKKYAVIAIETCDEGDYWSGFTIEYLNKDKEIAKEYAMWSCARWQKKEHFQHGYLEDKDGEEVYRPYKYGWELGEYKPTEEERRDHARGEYYVKYSVEEASLWSDHESVVKRARLKNGKE